MKTEYSIIVPAFNETERIGQTLRNIFSYVERMNISAELLVIDDGSRDDTAQAAQNVFDEFPAIEASIVRYEQNRGKGFAVKAGLSRARGEIALFSDADLSTPIEEFEKLVEPIKNDLYDVTFGSRALDRKLIETRQPWRREQSGKIFNLAVRALTGLPFWDTQCGFKAFNMTKFRPLLPLMTIERFGFDVELLFAANYRKLRLKEIPVRWNHCEGSKISVFRDSQRMFREIIRVRRNAKSGFYDADHCAAATKTASVAETLVADPVSATATAAQTFPAVELGNRAS